MTEIKITRRIALDKPYEYYELEANYDPAEVKGNKTIKDIEKQVAFIRKLTAPKEPTSHLEAAKAAGARYAKKEAAKIPTKKPIPEGYKEVEPESSEDTKIADIKAGEKVNINVRFEKAGEPQAFINKADGSPGRYVKVDVADASGKMKLTLFGEQCDLIKDIKPNAWLKIENAYCKDYKGSLELSIAYGKMEVVYNG